MSTPPDLAGFLQKAGGKFIKQNQTRWFELRGTTLYWFKNKPTDTNEAAQGSVDIRDTKLVNNDKERFSWTITGPQLAKSYTLYASSEQEKMAWIQAIQNPNLNYGGTNPQATKNDSDEDESGGATASSMVYTTQGRKVGPDDFDVLRVIGKGSFGKVMQVRKKDSGEIFAMKEMSKEIIERENLLEHTFAEKSILQKIDHPFICSLHYAFQTKDKLYLVLDFLSGGELFYHLSQVGTFDLWRAKFYCAQIGLAIGHLHQMNIIYRDLKPENAVLDKDGNVCLTDFGLAKTNVQGANGATTFCGTPEYLAPEFLLGGGHGKAVDWWSLGVLLYEMMCGIPPFYDENVNTMYELILKKPLEFPDGVSPEARDLLCRLLDRNAESRMQHIDQFRSHPFFADLDFVALFNKQLPPPFKPDQNAVNFDPEFTAMKARLSTHEKGGHVKIAGFTYEGKQ